MVKTPFPLLCTQAVMTKTERMKNAGVAKSCCRENETIKCT